MNQPTALQLLLQKGAAFPCSALDSCCTSSADTGASFTSREPARRTNGPDKFSKLNQLTQMNNQQVRGGEAPSPATKSKALSSQQAVRLTLPPREASPWTVQS